MSRRLLFCAVLALTVPLAGCTAADEPPAPPRPTTHGGATRLVAFDSCRQLFADLRKAAKAAVGPYGLPGDQVTYRAAVQGGARTMADAADSRQAPAASPAFSGTNVHEQGADEPDLIKTDGRRIVTVAGGVLRVIDVATRRETGKVDLGLRGAGDLQLLLTGNAALVLVPADDNRPFVADKRVPQREGSQVLLVDLTGPPTVSSRYRGEGTLVDARMTGSTARVVLRSTPRIPFPAYGFDKDSKQL